MNINTSLINSSLADKPLDPKSVLRLYLDSDLLNIWQEVRMGTLTAKQIQLNTHIPQTTLYRKLTWLLEHGIIKGVVKREGYNYCVKFYSLIETFSGELNVKGQKLTIKLWGQEMPIELVTMTRIKQ